MGLCATYVKSVQWPLTATKNCEVFGFTRSWPAAKVRGYAPIRGPGAKRNVASGTCDRTVTSAFWSDASGFRAMKNKKNQTFYSEDQEMMQAWNKGRS